MKRNTFILEDLIRKEIEKTSKHKVKFAYAIDSLFFEPGKTHTIKAITYNPQNDEEFLLTKISADSHEECLEIILKELIDNNSLSSFTVVWSKKGDQDSVQEDEHTKVNNKEDDYKSYTSYFTGKDVREVIEKFYACKENPNDYVIYEIKMNPMA